ncbi:SRPBCC family protein [Nocardiopsis sp. NPDC050513]|uniref:SRPBCC family protein n=1 Tax=Nocardiopsis sp. NPDC050513 TaxID=3364338 RepID=UPI0037A6D036
MEYGSIERQIRVDAAPEIVYQVLSRPEHLRQWWPDEAELDPVPGATGTVSFGGGSRTEVVALTVVEADPPRRFSFRWTHDEHATATEANSLLVTFDLVASAGGTLVRFTETGFRERGWEAAVLEERYRDNTEGWDRCLPRLADYAARLVSTP